MYSLPLSTAPISGPLLVISTAANLVLGFVVIVSDFLATAIPDTIEHAQLTAVRSRTKRKQMTRKNVVAPLLEAATPMAAQQGDSASIVRGPTLQGAAEDVVRLPSATAIPELDVERVAGISNCAPGQQPKRKSKARKLPGVMSSVRSSREMDSVDQADLF
jgi:hypothetical protein